MWNESAWQAARELWQPGDRVGDQNHSGDWGQYGDLQLGNVDRSELWIERAEQTLRENPGDGRSSATLKTMRARHVIETQQWQLTALSDELSADELLALGLSAAHLGDLDLAERRQHASIACPQTARTTPDSRSSMPRSPRCSKPNRQKSYCSKD